MTRVTSRAAKALASALVAASAVAISPTSTAWAAEDLTSDPRALIVESAQQPNELQKILQTVPAVEQAVVQADFWSRSSSAIRATRSFSALRWGTPAYAKWYAREHITRVYNWDDKQFGCLVSLWTKESNWRYNAVSKNKKWWGIPQATKYVVNSFGLTVPNYMRTPELQIQAGTRYINYRYGSPCAAWKHSAKKGWY